MSQENVEVVRRGPRCEEQRWGDQTPTASTYDEALKKAQLDKAVADAKAAQEQTKTSAEQTRAATAAADKAERDAAGTTVANLVPYFTKFTPGSHLAVGRSCELLR